MSGSDRANGGMAGAAMRSGSGDRESPAITYDKSRYPGWAVPMGFAVNASRIDLNRSSALPINNLNIDANQD